jgi:hypothetical protein
MNSGNRGRLIARVVAAAAFVVALGVGPFHINAARAEMSAADKLMAIEEIHQLKARYFRCVDGKDWPCFLDVFAPDVKFKMPGGERQGRADMMQMMHDSGFYDRLVTTHHGFMPEIEILTPTTARGIWTMEDIIYYPAGLEPKSDKEPLKPGQSLHGYGHYHETYVKIKGKWYIQTEELTRTRVDKSEIIVVK